MLISHEIAVILSLRGSALKVLSCVNRNRTGPLNLIWNIDKRDSVNVIFDVQTNQLVTIVFY